MFNALNPRMFFIQPPETIRFPYCGCLYIEDERRALIDTGVYRDDMDILLREKRPEWIINSHMHEDHILGNKSLAEALRPRFSAHILDKPAIASPEVFLDYYGFKELGMEATGRAFLRDYNVTFAPVDDSFTDMDVLDFGRTKLTVIHLPGHSPGHCGFYYEPEAILWGSDIELSSFGPWYGHKVSDLDAFITSIERCIDIAPAVFISSHRGVFRDKLTERLLAYRDQIYVKEEKIYQALRSRPATLEDLALKRLYYGPKIPRDGFVDFQERYAIFNHLKHLLKQRRIICQDGVYAAR
jgi:glyoxylase-like metal-dependent hydrolase (beta-lactamase superfamily II)